jgi:hypothetical protein
MARKAEGDEPASAKQPKLASSSSKSTTSVRLGLYANAPKPSSFSLSSMFSARHQQQPARPTASDHDDRFEPESNSISHSNLAAAKTVKLSSFKPVLKVINKPAQCPSTKANTQPLSQKMLQITPSAPRPSEVVDEIDQPPTEPEAPKKHTFSVTACESAVNGKSGSTGLYAVGSVHIVQRESQSLLVKPKPEYQLMRVTATSGKQVYDVRTPLFHVMCLSIVQIGSNILNVFRQFLDKGKVTIELRSPSVYLAICKVRPRASSLAYPHYPLPGQARGAQSIRSHTVGSLLLARLSAGGAVQVWG